MLKTAQFIGDAKTQENPFLRGDMGNYLKVRQAMKLLGISRPSVYKYVAEGKLHCKREPFGPEDDPDTIVELKFDLDELNRFGALIKKRRRRGQKLI